MNIKSVKKIKSIMDGSFAGYEVTTVDNTVWSVPLDTDNIKYVLEREDLYLVPCRKAKGWE